LALCTRIGQSDLFGSKTQANSALKDVLLAKDKRLQAGILHL